MLNDLLFYIKKLKINHLIVSVDKKQFSKRGKFVNRLSKQFTEFVKTNMEWFSSYDLLKVYYDYGQGEITQF